MNFHLIILQRTFRAEVLAYDSPEAHVKHLQFPVRLLLFFSFTLKDTQCINTCLFIWKNKNETLYEEQLGTFLMLEII